MKLGVVGVGVVGGAVYKYFESQSHTHTNVVGYDKYRDEFSNFDALLDCDALFLCLPTLYKHELKEYDKSAIHDVCQRLTRAKYNGLVVIKSTVEPGTTEYLSKFYAGLDFCHNPEFLTARTSYDDFANQTHIVLGKPSRTDDVKFDRLSRLLRACWPKADYSTGSSTDTECMKIFCNSFYAQKVSIFNEFYQVCQHNKLDYNHVLEMMLKNGWINPMHTNVPGPDGLLSFGGACFPKDIRGLNAYLNKMNSYNAIINSTIEESLQIRYKET